MKKPRIMIFCDYYLPSYKSGGGMWTIVNLVEHFRSVCDFFIVTRNYDSKSDTTPYTAVRSDEWNRISNAEVFYFSKKSFTQTKFAELIGEIKPDAFFLNSVFALPVIKFLAARRRRLFAERPIILAPCGEFSEGALSVKSTKKRNFLRVAKITGLYAKVVWKASFAEEREEILSLMGSGVKVLVAPDLPPREVLPEYSPDWKPLKKSGSLKMVFLSRLVRKKNLHYLLERLLEIDEGTIELDIVGPLEDRDYWRECLSIIKKMPPNISIREAGAFPRQFDALKKVAESHLFVLPTLNENFGYVFIEGMSAGCPILTSDRTVWKDLEAKNAGWRIPLEEPKKWIAKIKDCVQMDDREFKSMSAAARHYAVEWVKSNATVTANRAVLADALPDAIFPAMSGNEK